MNPTGWLGSLALFLVCCAASSAQDRAGAWRKGDVAPQGQWSVSLEYDTILARDLDDESISGSEVDDLGVVTGSLDPTTQAEDVELESSWIYLRGAYSLYAPDRSPVAVEAYLMLGFADAKLDGDVTVTGDPTESFDVDGDGELAVGLGVRARLYAVQQLAILADLSFRMSTHDSKIQKVTNLDLDPGVGETVAQDFKTSLLAWSLSASVSYRIDAGKAVITPYGGFRLSWVRVEVDGKQSFFDPTFDKTQAVDYDGEQSDVLGIFLGVEAAFSATLNAFLELRLVDELGLTLGAGWKF